MKGWCRRGMLTMLAAGMMLAPCVVRGENAAVSTADEEPSSIEEEALFSMEFRNAEVKDVLRALGQEYHLNLIIGNDIQGKLTLSFQRVGFEEALQAILRMNNLTSIRDGNIIRVMRSPFPDGEESFLTQMVPINFANVKEVKDTVAGLVSKKGSVMADVRTNTLVIRDVPINVEKIVQVVKQLDSKTPEVMIEARIVEVNTNYSRQLGVQWGALLGSHNVTVLGGATSSTVSSAIPSGAATSLSNTVTPLTGAFGFSGAPFAVNLPAAVGPGSGGALGLSFGSLGNTHLLDIQLSAMEDAGRGKILSNPRVLTLNNKEAKISSGTEILIPTTSIVATSISPQSSPTASGTSGISTGTGVTVIDAKLELNVTPHVTPDQQILLHIKTNKKDPNFSQEINNIPPLTTRTAETDVLVSDKQTIVIGGIYTRNESYDQAGVPWLSKIPLLGWLFKKEVTNNAQNELMIFITPTIYQAP